MARPLRRIRQRVGTALERWSNRRVEKLQQRAGQKGREASAQEMSMWRIQHEGEWHKYRDQNLRALEHTSNLKKKAEKQAERLRSKAKRVQNRHTSGWIGRSIRKIKGS